MTVYSWRMPHTVKVKTPDVTVKQEREDQAQKVIEAFGQSLPDVRLLCFFDDEECAHFKHEMGKDNRAFHRSISDKTAFPGWPGYLTDCIFTDDRSSMLYKRLVDHVIYLHGSTCANKVGMTMSFAHELQHVIQRVNAPEVLSANGIVRFLPEEVIKELDLQWADIPVEWEARATAKRVAVAMHGKEEVDKFIEERFAVAVNPLDRKDLQFIRQMEPSDPYDIKNETVALFVKLKKYRKEVEETIEHLKAEDPDYEPVDLGAWMKEG
jgi:hypothetical protein